MSLQILTNITHSICLFYWKSSFKFLFEIGFTFTSSTVLKIARQQQGKAQWP